MPDGTTDFLDLDTLQHMESNYGIFVSDAGKDQQRLDQIKGLAQAMIQNGTKASMVAEMFESENFSQIKGKLKAAEKAAEELEQAQQQAQQQQAQQQMQMQQQEMERASIDKEKDRQLDIEVALINAEARKNPELDSFNMQKLMQDFENKQRELDIRERELGAKINNDNEKNQIAREGDAE
jgi:esterase/lipase